MNQTNSESSHSQPSEQASFPVTFEILSGAIKGQIFIMPEDCQSFTFGRSPDCHAHIHHPSLARRHARCENINGQPYLVDHGTRNGCYLNEQRVGHEGQPIQNGDVIQIGEIKLRAQLGLIQR